MKFFGNGSYFPNKEWIVVQEKFGINGQFEWIAALNLQTQPHT